MGGTLPVLARFFTEAVQEVQRKVGLLYALNTFGAAFGTLAAALFFVPQLGNTRSTLLIAVLNIGIGVTAILMASRHSRAHRGFRGADTHRLPEESEVMPERTGSFLRPSQRPDLCR